MFKIHHMLVWYGNTQQPRYYIYKSESVNIKISVAEHLVVVNTATQLKWRRIQYVTETFKQLTNNGNMMSLTLKRWDGKNKIQKILPLSALQYKNSQQLGQNVLYIHFDGLNAAAMASSSVLVVTEIGMPYTSSPSIRRFALQKTTTKLWSGAFTYLTISIQHYEY